MLAGAVNLWAFAPHLTSQGWATLASIATVLAGVASVLGLFWSAPGRRAGMAVLGVLAYLDPLRGLKRDVALIKRELQPNGGTSISDKVNAIWTRQGMTAAKMAMLLDESDALLWQSDLNGRQTWASRALVEATGRPASELLGMGWVNVIHGADQERIRKAWLRCMAEHRNFEDQCRFVRFDGTPEGEILHGRLVAKPFKFDGQVIGWIGRCTLDAPPAPPERRSAPRTSRR